MSRRLLVICVTVGCGRSAARTPPSPSDAAPAPDHFDAIIDGVPVALRSAKAVADVSGDEVPGLSLLFSDRDETCASIRGRDAVRLSLPLYSGPGDTYFAGQTIGTWAETPRVWEGLPGPRPSSVRLHVDPFEPHAGAHITGTLDIASAVKWPTRVHGKLDVELCDDPPRNGLPAAAPDAPAAGDIVVGSAVALVEPGVHVDELRWIVLSPRPDLPCPLQPSLDGNWQLKLTGVRMEPASLGVPLPASLDQALDYHKSGSERPAWVRLDALPSAPGGDLELAIVAATVAGKLRARVCRVQ